MATVDKRKSLENITWEQYVTQLINKINSVMNSYKTKEAATEKTLDETHHAYVMPTFGENAQQEAFINQLKAWIQEFSRAEWEVTFDLQGAVDADGGRVTMDTWICPQYYNLTLPNLPSGTKPPETGQRFCGWSTTATAAVQPNKPFDYHKAGSKYELTKTSTTFYAIWRFPWDYVPPEDSST